MNGNSMVRRAVALAFAVMVLSVPAALPAHAEPDYPPVFNKISASQFVVARGATVAFKAQTYQAGAAVVFRVETGGDVVTSGTSAASAKGVVTETITFDVLGTNTVTFAGTGSRGGDLTLSTRITVTAADDGSGDGSGGTGDGSGDAGDGAAAGGGTNAAGGSGDAAGGTALFDALPRTGAAILGTLLVGSLLVGGGALLLIASRRRHAAL